MGKGIDLEMFVCGQEKQSAVVIQNIVLTLHVKCVCVYSYSMHKTLLSDFKSAACSRTHR